MEHNTNAVPDRPSHGNPDQANLEAYGDWVTVAADPAPSAESAPATEAADNGATHQEPDNRAAQDLTAAEEQLLDQLAESERVAAAPAVAGPAPGAGDPHATSAALAKLERQLTSLNADLKAVGQQLAELRGRGGAVPVPAAASAAAEPPAAPTFDAEPGDDQLAITMEELENDTEPPWDAADSTPQVAAGDAAEVAHGAQAHVPSPGGREAPAEDEVAGDIQLVAEPVREHEHEPPAAAAVETLPAEDPLPAAPVAAGGAEIGGQVREEVRSVLAYLDQLLDALPPEKVREFAQSKHFGTYKKLFREFGLDD